MPPNLRLSLTIFSVGFAIESAVDLYHLVTGSSQLVAGGALFLLGSVATVLGLLFLWIGRHEWNEVHRARVRHAHAAFAAILALGAAAVGPVAYYLYTAHGPLPGWVPTEVGIAVGLSIIVTVWMYVVVVLHLVDFGGKALLGLSLAASVPPAYWIGFSVAQNLPTYVNAAMGNPPSLVTQVEPLFQLFSWLFASYLLLLVAFTDAHRRVVRGVAGAA